MYSDNLTAISGDIPAFFVDETEQAGRDTFNALAASVTANPSSSIAFFTTRPG